MGRYRRRGRTQSSLLGRLPAGRPPGYGGDRDPRKPRPHRLGAHRRRPIGRSWLHRDRTDLLSGTAPGGGNTADYGSEDKARDGIYKLPQPQVTADLDAVFKYATDLPAGNKKVAVAGFCWGGGQSFAYAAHNPKIAAAFVFYGSAPKEEAAYEKIVAPVYGFYGGKDFRISGEVPKVEKRMKELGKRYEPVIYEGAEHAFMRQGDSATDKTDPNRKAHDQAWESWKKLLGELK